MASEYRRLLDARGLTSNQEQRYDDVFDAGAYNKLQVQCRILRAATTSGTLKLQHAAVNEVDAYEDIAGATWDLSNTANSGFETVPEFLRYIRWVTTTITSSPAPIAIIDIIAKE